MFYGRGAGDLPTGSAVVSDIMDIGRDIIAGSASRMPVAAFRERSPLRIRKMDDITSCYYLRFAAIDKPGVLSRISGVLGKNNISIESVIQKGRGNLSGSVPVLILLDPARESALRRALEKIDRLPDVTAPTRLIRIEEDL